MDDERWKDIRRNGPFSRPVWKFSRRQRQAHVERVAVYRDQLEEAGCFPFVRYFWGPRPDDEEIRRCAPLLLPDGSKPKTMNDFFRAAYGPVVANLAHDSPLMAKLLPTATQGVGAPLSLPVAPWRER